MTYAVKQVLARVSVVAALGAAAVSFASTTAHAQPSQAEARQAIETFFGAVMSGDRAKVAAVLAPEYQIMRADGSGYDKAGYAASDLPRIAAMPKVTDLIVTAHGDSLVTRYYVSVNETRGGRNVQAHAPRLTVFRKQDGRWLVVAHGNFAALEGK